jgi:hypothetical protein
VLATFPCKPQGSERELGKRLKVNVINLSDEFFKKRVKVNERKGREWKGKELECSVAFIFSYV